MNSDLEAMLDDFADARGWGQHHLPRSLMLAMVKEVGELTELVQWIPDSEVACWLDQPQNKQNLADEMADICIYLHYLARATRVDLSQAILAKVEANAAKYPVLKEDQYAPSDRPTGS